MKIITVLHSLRSGGAERHALQLMRGLRARGHEALFAGSMNGWLGQQLTADGFGGINLPMVGIYDLPSVIRLALYARREKADLIHGHLTRGALGLADDEPCLLMAARIVTAKGHDTALKALARIKDQRWTLLLAGDHHGDLGPQIQALATELGIADRVRFLGLREDVPALLAAADMLLAPSRREALSLTLLEASACALPIVASTVGGIGEVVEHGASGLLVPPDDVPALADAIAQLLAAPEQRSALGARARQRFESGFTENAMFDGTLAAYREACSR